jgi:hypothetical protein
VKLQSKIPVLVVAASFAATGLALGPTAASAGTSGAAGTVARPSDHSKPKVVRIHSNDHKVNLQDEKFRPGVTEFRVEATAHNGSSLVILETKDLDRAFKLLGKAFQGGSGSADAMKKFDNIATLYGGGAEGARWQVRLSSGSYFMLDTKTNKLATFKVTGERRDVKMQHANSKIWATKDNQFQTDGKLAGKWVSFENNAREVHFMEADHVANDTTGKDVRKALKSNGRPDFARKGGFFFEVQSPGVKTVHRQDVPTGRYLLICFMPSEEQDGVPHAFMGMWHLVNAE